MNTATTVTVSVTQEHIDRGKPARCHDCPIALAIIAAMPGAVDASVFYLDCEEPQMRATVWMNDGTAHQLNLPDEADEFARAFDWADDEPVSPFTFTAELRP
jgi:hypothetical protein